MKVKFMAELKQGYRKPMEAEESNTVELVIEAKSVTEASRIFRALANMENIESYDCVCEEEEEDADDLFEEFDSCCCDDPCDYDDFCESDDSCYTPSSTGGDYSPSCPWNAPGMSVRDFI